MKQRAVVAAILGGLVAVFVLVVLIIGLGRHDPSPPSLAEKPIPAIPGELLWVDTHGCIVRAAASGATREQVYCPAQSNILGAVTWLENGGIGYYSQGAPGAVLIEIDLVTKQERNTGRILQKSPIGGPSAVSSRGEGVSVESGGDVFVTSGGVRTKIAGFDAPNGGVQPVTWSPDGAWILFQYYGRDGNGSELWILSRDGQTAGTIATGVRDPFGASWRIEGVGVSPALTSAQPAGAAAN
jgi:hypothetical protein